MPAPRFASAAASCGSSPAAIARREQRDHRIARARDVEHLARLGRQRVRLAVGEQRHALLAARHEQRFEIEIGAQLSPLRRSSASVGAAADDRLELAAVRRERERAAVALEVRALRVDEHRDARGSALRDELGRAAQRAFRVVRKHDDVRRAHELREAHAELGRAQARAIARRRGGSAVGCERAREACGWSAATASARARSARRAARAAPRAACRGRPRRRCRRARSARRARRCSARRWPRRPRAARRSASARRAPAPRARSAPCRRTNIRRASRRPRRARGRARNRES